jgi:hypothetical protein
MKCCLQTPSAGAFFSFALSNFFEEIVKDSLAKYRNVCPAEMFVLHKAFRSLTRTRNSVPGLVTVLAHYKC